MKFCGLSLRGESGLKYHLFDRLPGSSRSLPSRGEWIEIIWLSGRKGLSVSLPSRGEWIEICKLKYTKRRDKVSPFAGRVD